MGIQSISRVAVIGGGASGTLLAVQVLRASPVPLDVLLVEPAPRVGRGRAYDTPEPTHLLNAPAGRMSALPADPDHFARWLERFGVEGAAGRFVPRQLYGMYLEETLADACRGAVAGARLLRIRGNAEAVGRDGRTLFIRVDGRREAVCADRIALAIGDLRGRPPLPGLAEDARYVDDPWQDGALARVAPDDAVLILGTGLTMVDVALYLDARGHQGPIAALSRHGLLPGSHVAPSVEAAAPPLLDLPPRVRLWLRAVRAADAPDSWWDRIDALRPIAPALWRRLDLDERRRFLRHVRPYWDVARHRMAPSVAQALGRLTKTRRLEIVAGRIVDVRRLESALELTVRRRGASGTVVRMVDRLVNATGPATDIADARSPLVRRLLRDGLARLDPLRLGFDATAEGRVIDGTGRPSPTLFALGPAVRGVSWETTAVPEIRRQAAVLAAAWLEAADSDRSAALATLTGPGAA